MIPPPARWAAAGLLATGLAALTGGLSSPLLALPALWLFRLPAGPFAPHAARIGLDLIVALGLFELGTGPAGAVELAGLSLLGVALLAGRLVTRRKRDRLADLEFQMQRIEAEATRPAPSSEKARAARRLEALRTGLLAATATSGAERAVVWDADLALRRLVARMASDGSPAGGWFPMLGSPLGWLAEEGEAIRFDARPPISARIAVIHATRLSREGNHAVLLALEFAPGADAPDPPTLASTARSFQDVLDRVDEHAMHVAFRERVEILMETLRNIPESIEPERFATSLVQDAIRLAAAGGGMIASWDGEAGEVLACAGADGGPSVGALFAATDSEVGLAARAGTALRVDVSSKRVGPKQIAAPGERWQHRPRHLFALPLPSAGATTGLLAVWRAMPLDPSGLELLESLAPFAGAQLARSLEFGRVRATAERDALTGLYNRRAFDRRLANEEIRFERYRHPLALLILDIDHFKAVNDTHGHEAGDQVLRSVADILANAVRDVDIVARFGGEEFVALLPETSLPAAVDVAERLRAAVEDTVVAWRGSSIPVRASIGVSACPECVSGTDELMRSADAALYLAKTEGRNRVAAAPVKPASSKPTGASGRRGRS